MQVIKRDGSKVDYDITKIEDAIYLSVMALDNDTSRADRIKYEVANEVDKIVQECDSLHVEQIQDFVERELLEQGHIEIGRTFMRYRTEKTKRRNDIRELDNTMEGIITTQHELNSENANKDSKQLNVQRDLVSGAYAKDYAMRHMIPKPIVKAHKDRKIHLHDLDYSPFMPMFNCMLIDFEGMLKNHFTMGNADITKPKTIKTASKLVAQIIPNVSSRLYGGTTANGLDEILEPYADGSYVRHLERAKEYNIENPKKYAHDMTVDEIYESMRQLEYDLNTIYNANGKIMLSRFKTFLTTHKWV